MLLPAADAGPIERADKAIEDELRRSLPGFAVTAGFSRHAEDAAQIYRAGKEALMAANVAESEGRSPLAFEETGSYRLLLPAMSEDPAARPSSSPPSRPTSTTTATSPRPPRPCSPIATRSATGSSASASSAATTSARPRGARSSASVSRRCGSSPSSPPAAPPRRPGRRARNQGAPSASDESSLIPERGFGPLLSGPKPDVLPLHHSGGVQRV